MHTISQYLRLGFPQTWMRVRTHACLLASPPCVFICARAWALGRDLRVKVCVRLAARVWQCLRNPPTSGCGAREGTRIDGGGPPRTSRPSRLKIRTADATLRRHSGQAPPPLRLSQIQPAQPAPRRNLLPAAAAASAAINTIRSLPVWRPH